MLLFFFFYLARNFRYFVFFPGFSWEPCKSKFYCLLFLIQLFILKGAFFLKKNPVEVIQSENGATLQRLPNLFGCYLVAQQESPFSELPPPGAC